MIWKVMLIILPNLLRASTRIPAYQSPKQNSVQQSTENQFPEYLVTMGDWSKNHNPVIKKTKNLNVVPSRLSLNPSRSRFIVPPKRPINETVILRSERMAAAQESKLRLLVESWLWNLKRWNDTGHIGELNLQKIQHNENKITFLQLWKKIRDAGNFTLVNTSMHVYDLYASDSIRNRTASGQRQSPIVLVDDRRYASFIEKWITSGRHGRHFSTDGASESAKNDSSTIPQNSCSSYANESENLHHLSNSTHQLCCSNDNYTSINVSEPVTRCNSSSQNITLPQPKVDTEDAQVRVYDPLMPYPEEYPEEYQTIQNGPALIISRTTYTRIPNVTYTTITIVTLPTYRLVQKAEDGFAATLFDESRSSGAGYTSRCGQLLQPERAH